MPETPLDGSATTLVGTFSLSGLLRLIAETEETVGVKFSQYRVLLLPSVQGSARVSGQGVNLDFNRAIPLTLDKYQLAVNAGEGLDHGQSGTVSTTVREPWVVNVPTLNIDVSYAWLRFTSLLLVGVSIGGLC